MFKFIIICFSLLSLSFNSYAKPINKQIEEIQLLANEIQKTEGLLELLDIKSLSANEQFLVLDTLTIHYYSQGNLDDALLFAKKSVALAQKNKFHLELGKALKNVGVMYYLKADIDAAIEYYKKAIFYYDAIQHPILRANLLNNIALAYSRNKQSIDALEYFKMANTLYQKYGSAMDKIDIKYNIAGLYINLGLSTNAIEILNEVITERLLIEDESGLFMAYADLVVALKKNEQFDEALAISHKVIDHYREKKDYYNLSAALHNISDVYIELLQPLKTKRYALEAIEYATIANHNRAYVGGLYTLSKAQLALGEIDLALKTIQTSNDHIKTLKNEKLSTVNNGVQSLLLMATGETFKAIDLYQKYFINIRNKYNVNFNNQLAKFESNQLKLELVNLKNKEKLNKLERESESRFKNITFISVAFTAIIIFLFYRKMVDKKIKNSLENQVNKRTNELKKANEKLLDLSYLDGLTKIKNRRCFDEDIKSLWDNKEKVNNLSHILIADIDFFKLYNDSYGHIAGDKALTKVADIIKNNIRDEDKVYRYGGEEFAIIFYNCNSEVAINASLRIIDKIQSVKIEHANSEFNVVTLSAGINTLNLSTTLSIEDFIRQADQNLYKAKEDGRNQLCHV